MLMTSSKRIQDLLIDCGYTIKEFSIHSGISVGVVSELLKRDKLTQFKVIRKLAKAFGVVPRELIIEQNNPVA